MANRAERRRVKTSELREQAIEALGQEPYIDIETDNGEVFRIWHPLLVDDATQIRIADFQQGAELDRDEDGEIKIPVTINGVKAEPTAIRSARAILGPEEHARFIAAGGHSNDIQLAWTELSRNHDETDTVLSEVAQDEDPKSVLSSVS